VGGRVRRRPSNPARSVPAAVSCLARLLREAQARALLTRAGGVPLLAALRGPTGVPPSNLQLLYESTLCLWQLSYYPQAAEAEASGGVVAGLTETARTASKEKVGCQRESLERWGVKVHAAM
jgi:V-type H+-transporting ATPase subunit H